MLFRSVLIHQLSSGVVGTSEDIEQENENCQTIMNTIKSIYYNNTKMTKRQIEAILKKDQYFTSKECLKYNLVDIIL